MYAHIYETLPESIKELPIFILYRTEAREDGTLNKIPYQANGRKASSTDPDTWNTFDNAIEAYSNGDFSGIGLILVPPLCCIDLDHLRNKVTGDLHPTARK